MKYRGVEGSFRYNRDIKMFVGELKNVDDFIPFRGSSLNEAHRNFMKAVDYYLASNKKECTKDGRLED